MFRREIAQELLSMAAVYPVVTLMGPRQSGKTTLVKALFPGHQYVNLERPETRHLAETDPESFMMRYQDGAIFDEVQRVPALLSYIQVLVDEHQKKGLFILTGSRQVNLSEAISQSLAGRTAILKLLPFSLNEMQLHQIIPATLEETLLYGSYPMLYTTEISPYKYYSHYCQTYLERDVRQIINVSDLTSFQHFMRLCAARVGCPINASDLGNELGISSPTVKRWLSILEASFLTFNLPPYAENIGKRLSKTAKLYFTDVGLVTYLMGIENAIQLETHPLRGALFENLVILEALKKRHNLGKDPQFFYYRDKAQHEVDLILQQGHQLFPIEIKSSRTYRHNFRKGLDYLQKLLPNRIEKGAIIYAGTSEQNIPPFQLYNYLNTAKLIR